MLRKLGLVSLLEMVWLMTAVSGMAQVSVLTQHNDVARTGQNLNETILNTSNVKTSGFGKLFWRTVDGYIYTQPLYVPGLNIQGKTRNVVYVATEHNSVYAFDADDPAQAAPLWTVNLGTAVPSQDICVITGDTDPGDCPYLDINPEIGITSTPVIDSGLMYVVAKTKKNDNTYHFFLHALDILSGAERLGGPAEITGQVTGGGLGSVGGVLTFDPTFHLQRPGLLLLNGVIYLGFGSVGDIGTFHGWLMGYDADTLAPVSILCITPNGKDGGIWQAGTGLASDGLSNIFVMTGNGNFDANVSGNDYGDSFLRVSTSSGLTIADYFTPSNQASLFSGDVDLGSGGPILMPGTSLLVGLGKDKLFRVVDSSGTNMGHFNSGFDNDVQQFTATVSPFFGSPVYWNSPNNGPVVYLWGPSDFLKGYKFVGGQFSNTPASQSTIQNSSGFSNSAALSLSANSSLVGSGIIWTSASLSGKATGPSVGGIVRAFDATDLTKELWDSRQNAARDDVGLYAKFTPPTITNGKVYVPSFSGQLLVYGLAPPAASGIQFVQVGSSTPGTTTASVTAAYPSAQILGNFNLVAVSWKDSTAAVQSVTDSLGNTYSLAIGPTTGTSLRQSIYFAKNIRAGSNSVTVTFNVAAVSPDVRVLEYKGVDTVSPLDGSLGASGNSAFPDSGFINTTNANDLIVGANIVNAKNIVAGAPFTTRVLTSTTSNIVADRLVNLPGSYHSWTPLVSSAPWVMQAVAFKAASSTGSTAPAVGGVSPGSGPIAGGTPVTVSGQNFAAGATVSFGGVAATGVTVVNSTTITATTPAHAVGAVNVVVTNLDSQTGTLANGFTYTSGTGGGGSISFVQVKSATPQSASASVAVAYTAAQTAGNTNIVAVGWNDTTSTVSSVTDSRGNAYTLAVGPTTGTGLRQSIYYAKNIGSGSNTVTVAFNQAAAFVDVRALEYSGLDTSAPLDQATGASGTSSTPNSGAVNTTSANELIFGAGMTAGRFTAGGAGFTSRIITSPDGDIAEDLVVGSIGNNSASAPMSTSTKWVMQVATFKAAGQGGTAPAPTISSISPVSGTTAGGTVVTITGANFQSGATVTFGSTAATGVTVVSSTSIKATTPALTAGRVSVVVTNPDAQSATLTNGYTFINPPPTITSISPVSGTIAGGTSVSIAGTGFQSGATVSFGGTPATAVTFVSSVSITATTPAHAAGAVNVIVANPDSQSATSTNGYTYASGNPAPTVSSISPTFGTTAGGTGVSITGAGFLAGATVSFGGMAATGVTVVNSTTITATTPAHAIGAVNVVVTNTDAKTGTLTNGYTYTTSGGGGTIKFVQVKSATPQSASASVAVTYPLAQISGNLNIVAVGWNDTTSTVSSVTDSRGNSYVLAVGPTSGTGLRQSIYYAKNIVAGTNTVTVAFNQAAVFVDVRVLEYSGLDTSTPFDKAAGAAGSSNSASSGAVTPTVANELIFGAGMTAGRFTAAGTGYGSRIITTPDGDIAEDQVQTAIASISATAPLSTNTSWVMQIATFRAAP
jgi:hypothetical protein